MRLSTGFLPFSAKKPNFTDFGPFKLFRGSVSNLECKPDADPEPKAVWSRNGTVIVEGDRYRLLNDGRNLEIHNVKYSDKGAYTCNATNVVGFDVATGSVSVLGELLSCFVNVHVYKSGQCQFYRQFTFFSFFLFSTPSLLHTILILITSS